MNIFASLKDKLPAYRRLAALLVLLLLSQISLALFDIAVSELPSAKAAILPGQSGFQINTVLGGLTQPTAMQFAPLPDSRVFVAEKSGRIVVYSNVGTPGAPITTFSVFANLEQAVHNYQDRGLSALVLDYDFPARPYVYVAYSYNKKQGDATFPRWTTTGTTSGSPNWYDGCPDPGGFEVNGCAITSRVSRLTVSNNGAGNTMVNGSEVVLLEGQCQQFGSHSVGTLAFGPDNALYASFGEGANYNATDIGEKGDNTKPGHEKNPCADPPGAAGTALTAPTSRGGALRAQSPRRPAGEPRLFNGSIVRIEPSVFEAADLSDLTPIANPDGTTARTVSYGFRNPFRYTFRPNTDEIWVGDVGASEFEEINRIPSATDALVENFGWPCYQGSPKNAAYQNIGLQMCDQLYNSPGEVTNPYLAYSHAGAIIPGQDTCVIEPNTGGLCTSAISAITFYKPSTQPGAANFPSSYDDALFWGDYAREGIWVLFKGANGLPDPSSIVRFAYKTGTSHIAPVDLKVRPHDGKLYFIDIFNEEITQISYLGSVSNPNPPEAIFSTSTTTPPIGGTVTFDGTASFDPDNGQTLTYAWDLDGDGIFGEINGDDGITSTSSTNNKTYSTAGTFNAALRVTDSGVPALNKISSYVVIKVGAPIVTINTPLSSLEWKVGDNITFSGSATDPTNGNAAVPASKLKWTIFQVHCTSVNECHDHTATSYSGIASGSFFAPAHGYPSYLRIELEATGSAPKSLTNSASRSIQAKTTVITFASNVSGAKLGVAEFVANAPYNYTGIVNAPLSVSAGSPQIINGKTYLWDSWSDAQAQNHTYNVPAVNATLTANFCNALMVNSTADTTPAANCDITLRKALTSSYPGPIEIDPALNTSNPITLTAPLDVPANRQIMGDCVNRVTIASTTTHQLVLKGSNTLKGLILGPMSTTTGKPVWLEGLGNKFECTTAKTSP